MEELIIDPLTNLAFSMSHNKGVYALLLGSGISKNAEILTGWGITKDLVNQLASIRKVDIGKDWHQWYLSEYHNEPDYSQIINELANTPEERQNLLRSYFEPSKEEREKEHKVPTTAHRAIAQLMASGHIQLVVTTNFDRLLETALSEFGVIPQVISSLDALRGAIPIRHMNHCIVKLHGDYLDTRFKNTSGELSQYDDEFNSLLDTIIDEYGLVICGWSADWDEALREAILRAKNRRYTTYFSYVDTLSDNAEQVIKQRGAVKINMTADDLFETLKEQVLSLDQYSRPHPTTVDIAVATMKRYMADPNQRIRLDDFVNNITTNTLVRVGRYINERYETNTEKADLVIKLQNDSSVLVAIAAVGGFHHTPHYETLWVAIMQRLMLLDKPLFTSVNQEAHRVIPRLVLYALCIGAVRSGQLELITALLQTPVLQNAKDDSSIAYELSHVDKDTFLCVLPRRPCPTSEWMYSTLRECFIHHVPEEEIFRRYFNSSEILISLGMAYRNKQTISSMWFPVGIYGYQKNEYASAKSKIIDSMNAYGDASQYVQIGLFGTTKNQCLDVITEFDKILHEQTIGWF